MDSDRAGMSNERVELKGHQPRSQPPVPAWLSLPVGLALVLAGVLLTLYRAGRLPRFGRPDIPLPLILPFALICAFLGVALAGAALRRAAREARLRRAARERPGEPWLSDHAWDPRGTADDTLARSLGSLVGAMVFTVFLVPFNWLAFFSRGELPALGRIAFGLVTSIFDALVVGLFGYGVYLLIRRARYGESRLHFETFPFLLGEPLAARLRAGRKGLPGRRMSATLRCVEERYESRGSDSSCPVCYRVFSDTRPLPPAGLPAREGWQAHLAFDLPDLPLGTRLSARPPRYWELEVRVAERWVDYTATFLVPVYERPGEGPGGGCLEIVQLA